MIAKFKPCILQGEINAVPSKSMAHRYLIGAALSKQKCTLKGVDYSEDILASIDCLRALGANIIINNGESAGQSINHLHLHIIPRKDDDGIGVWKIPQNHEDLVKVQKKLEVKE